MRTWNFILNTFEINTRRKNKALLSLGADHLAKIKAKAATDPDFLQMQNDFETIFEDYDQIFTQHSMAKGEFKGDTLGLKQVMQKLNDSKLKEWEGGIHALYPEDSPDEIALFPRKRRPFQESTYETRLMAVQALSEKLQAIPALATTYANVSSFYNLMLTTRQTQKGVKGKLGILSKVREQQRKLVCEALYGNLGLLMRKYRKTPLNIKVYFDLSLVQRKKKKGED